MILKDLKSKEIIQMVLGDERIPVKNEDELALLLKKRMTKKELEVLNAKVSNISQEETMKNLNIDEARYNTLLANAFKKIKNEAVHGDFFYN